MLNYNINRILTTSFLQLFILIGYSQSPNDITLMNSGQLCIAGIYQQESWKEYWEGDSLRSNKNIGTMKSNIYGGMCNIGLHNRINFIAGLSFVDNKGTGGQILGQHGFQNAALFLKGLLYQTESNAGKLELVTTTGFIFPLTDYVPDAPYAIGLGCSEFVFRPILQVKHKIGIFLRLNAAYMKRGTAELLRDYYFTTTGHYSNKVDVPNAMEYNAVLGFQSRNEKFKAEIEYFNINTLGGFDVRSYDIFFPSNEIDFSRIGASVKYYWPFVKGLGTEIYYRQTLDGLNVGKASSYGLVLSYFFSIIKKEQQ